MLRNTVIKSGSMPRKLKLVVFDYDGTIVDDQSERIFQGLNSVRAYNKNEQFNQHIPHNIGLCFSFFHWCVKNPSIKVMILTARGQAAKDRMINTLQHHKVMIPKHNIIMRDGKCKTTILEQLKPCLYIDDQPRHLVAVDGVCMLEVKQ